MLIMIERKKHEKVIRSCKIKDKKEKPFFLHESKNNSP